MTDFSTKYLRIKNWSAPFTMSIFIIFCMIVIFSFESLGLSNKEKNIDFRRCSHEAVSKHTNTNLQNFVMNDTYKILNSKINRKIGLSKLEAIDKIFEILIIGAKEQYAFEYDSLDSGITDFYDI